jgi:hypothetical protein
MKKAKEPKKVVYELLSPDMEIGRPIYELLKKIMNAHHEELVRTNARVALAWCKNWKADVDGIVTIGKCKKASELDRELASFDFVILLSQSFWYEANEKQRAALLDHELMHAAVQYDADGEPVVDTRGRQVYRTRKHDLEEFSDIVGRHGCYKRDLEQFATALERARAKTGTGWVGYTSLAGRLEHAGLAVPLERVIEWGEDKRRQAMEWLNLRRELMNASSGGAAVPSPPAFVLAALDKPLLQEAQGTH